ncbi:MAG: PepSY domain-containing protein [Psychromonas sp.]
MKIASMLILTICLTLPFATSARSDQSSAKNSKTASSSEQSLKLKVKSRAQAIQLAQRQFRGKVLKAQSSSVNNHPGYEVKMLSKEGVVFYVSVDAETGRLSRN